MINRWLMTEIEHHRSVMSTAKVAKSLSERGPRPCRRSAAAHGKRLNAPGIRGLLRLVEDDTAALRDFQTGSNRSCCSIF